MPKFTERFIQAFRPSEGQKDRLVFDTECTGLGLRATATGKKIFIVQWTDPATRRKQRETIGTWGSITLEKARDAAKVKLGRVAQGVNPREERLQARAEDLRLRAEAARVKAEAAFTLEALIEQWVRLRLAGRAPRYVAEAERALRSAFAKHLAEPAAALSRVAVLKVLDAMASAGKAPLASRTQAYGRACYALALKRGRLLENPFASLPVIAGGTPQRDRVLTDAEVGAIWRAAGKLGHPFGPMVRLLLLTAQRREEVAGMRWSELSADHATWVLPKERSKNDRAHVVHLCPEARDVLASIRQVEGWDLVFTVTGKTPPSGFTRAKEALVREMLIEAGDERAIRTPGKKKDQPLPKDPVTWRFHDFRRTAVTWLAGNGFPPHVADRILNHVTGAIQGVAAIYQRYEFLAERKAALEAWGKHVMACGEGRVPDSKVVPMKRNPR
jgi:integrase